MAVFSRPTRIEKQGARTHRIPLPRSRKKSPVGGARVTGAQALATESAPRLPTRSNVCDPRTACASPPAGSGAANGFRVDASIAIAT